jgi:RES domain-containing protein
LLGIATPDSLGMKELKPATGVDWRNRLDLTRRLGDAWLASRETTLARVPSAIVPRTWNVLLNPVHPDAKQVKIESVTRERFDNRLFRYGAS